MPRLKVFISHTHEELAGSYSEGALDDLRLNAELVFNRTGRILAGTELAEAAAECDVILAHRSTPGEAATFEASPCLLAFLRSAVDVSTVDVDAACAHGVLITRASAGFGVAVAELALGMMFDLRAASRAHGMRSKTIAHPDCLKGWNCAEGRSAFSATARPVASLRQ